MIANLLTRRAVFGGLAFAVYGLWEACARLPAGLGFAATTVSALWATAIFAAAGVLLAGAIAGLGVTLSWPMPLNRRATTAAILESFVWLPLILWLVLNEVIYSTTSEVLGYDAMLMTWHNPEATFQNAWQMGSRYLIAVGVVTIVLAVVLAFCSRRSFRCVWPSRATDVHRTALHTAGEPPHPLRVAVPVSTGLLLLATALSWQICTKPSLALTNVFRSAPPLKALSLTRAIIGDELRMGDVPPTGPPIITDETYAARLAASRATPSPVARDGVKPGPPNLVLIVLESVPAKALHCYGYEREVSPNMDALAAAGRLFEHCWSTASFSSYGLISIMTSLYLLRDEFNDGFADTSFPNMSIPRALKLAGYETGMFSSGNEAFDHINAFCRPSDFDHYYSQDTSKIEHPDCMRMDDHYAVEEFERWMKERSRAAPPWAASAATEGRRYNPLRSSRPFYASFYLQSTHFDYAVPKPWSEHFQPTPSLLGNGNKIIKIPPDALPMLRNQFDNAMRYSDDWVGRIVEALKKAGAFDNCAIAIIGDHGEAFMEHGLARHGVHLWEEMIHVPLILYVGPVLRQALGHPLPARVPDTVSGLDVAPTLAALAGMTAHPSWQGVNILAPGYTSQDRPIYSVLQLTRWQEAVTINKLKYIYDLSDVERYLFDLKSDPGEKRNLIEQRGDWARPMHDLLRVWHTHQLSYYSPAHRPFTRYIGVPSMPQSGGVSVAKREAGSQ